MLGRAERVGEAHRGAARRRWFLLACMRRPSHQIDDLEARHDLALGRRVTCPVDVFGALERPA